jgi:O-antigen ligase
VAAAADSCLTPSIGAGVAIFSVAAVLLLPVPVAIAVTALLCLAPLAWFVFAIPTRWMVWFFAGLILLPPLPFSAGDNGPHPAVLVAGIGILAAVARADSWQLEWSALNLSFAGLLAAMAVSLGFALAYSGPQIALGSAARVVLFSLSVFVLLSASQGPDRQTHDAGQRTARTLFWIAVAAAAFGCVDFVSQLPAPAGFEPQFLFLESGVYRRAQGLFYEASTLGNFCTFFLIMAGVGLVQPRSRRLIPAPVLCAGIVVLAGAMLLSFSRASVLAAGLAFLTLAILERRRWRRHRALVAVLLMMALLAGGWMAFALPEVSAGYWARFTSVLDNMLAAPDRVLSGRLESWNTIAGFIAANPWQTAFGIGYKTLPYTHYLGKPVIADNMYLSLLVETGVAGLLALIAVNAAILAVSWRALKRGSFYGKWMFCFWIGEVFQMLSGDIFTYWRVLPVYLWVLAQVVRDAGESGAEEHAGLADRPIR